MNSAPSPTALEPATTVESSPTLVQPVAAPARTPLSVLSSGATDKGRVRDSNQDQFLVATFTGTLWVEQSSFPQERVQCGLPQGHLFAVADGMGGHAGGEQASQLAMGAIETFMLEALGWLDRLSGQETAVLDELRAALRRADATVAAAGRAHPELHHMGTTLTLAYSIDDVLYLAHAGDSRCYLMRAGELHQLTQDHTVAGDLVAAGVIGEAAARTHGLRHIVTNVVGGGQPGVMVEVHKIDLLSGDAVLLCSDGLTEVVNDAALAQVLLEEPDPRAACDRLIQSANAGGGPDNVTAIVARWG